MSLRRLSKHVGIGYSHLEATVGKGRIHCRGCQSAWMCKRPNVADGESISFILDGFPSPALVPMRPNVSTFSDASVSQSKPFLPLELTWVAWNDLLQVLSVSHSWCHGRRITYFRQTKEWEDGKCIEKKAVCQSLGDLLDPVSSVPSLIPFSIRF